MRRRRRRGRPPIPVVVNFDYKVKQVVPIPTKSSEYLVLTKEELEALRLVDYEGLTQEEAAERMNCSRSKVWRLLVSGRKKIIEAIIEGKQIVIE